MRIVHLSTHDVLGGAARAAFRLHEGLRAVGVDSAMLVNWKHSNSGSVYEATRPNDDESFWTNLLQENYIDDNRAPVSDTYFSLGWPGFDVSAHPLVQQADVIHLHWVALFQSPATLSRLAKLGKPIVWTLHDQRAFTGGCHYSAGCERYERDCRGCPQLMADPNYLPAVNLAEQLRIAAPGTITVVAPSRWMAEAARQSAMFSQCPIEVVPNGIDTEVFRPRPRREARTQLDLPADGFQLLFGADSCTERRKGFPELIAALEHCRADAEFSRRVEAGKFTLLAFGRQDSSCQDLPVPVRAFGQIGSDDALSAIYSAADLFVLPSLEDNLPNTVLESMSCGTPVAAFRTGGVPEMVLAGITGHLAPVRDVKKLAQLILSASREPERLALMSTACRRQIEEFFTLRLQAERCQALYQRLCQAQPEQRTKRAAHTSAERETSGLFVRGPALVRAHKERGRLRSVPWRTTLSWEASFVRALRKVLAEDGTLLDHLPTSAQDEIEGRFRRRRLQRRLKALLKSAEKGRLSYADLIVEMSAELASLEEPITARKDRKKLHRMQAAERFLTRYPFLKTLVEVREA